MFGQVGTLEIIVVLAIALIVLGPKRLPSAARQVGKGMRELREQLNFSGSDDDDDDEPDIITGEKKPKKTGSSSESAS